MSRIAGLVVLAVLMALVAAFPAGAQVPAPPKTPTAEGRGGSAATRRPARHAGGDRRPALRRQRGRRRGRGRRRARRRRAVLVRHRRRRLHGHLRRQAPQGRHDRLARDRARRAAADRVHEPSTAQPSRSEARASSGLSVGVPGTVRGWETALKRYGTRSLRSLLRPGERIAREGFVVDQTFAGQVDGQRGRSSTTSPRRARLYLTPARHRDRRSARSSATRTWPRPTSASRADPDSFYTRRDRARHRADRAAPARGAGLRPAARRAPAAR